jgi:uncharacterized protein YihD (DUF1040 family)
MARDPERIEAMVVALRMLWKKYPDLRLGQLVLLLAPDTTSDRDIFYIEDDVWLKRIMKAIEANAE